MSKSVGRKRREQRLSPGGSSLSSKTAEKAIPAYKPFAVQQRIRTYCLVQATYSQIFDSVAFLKVVHEAIDVWFDYSPTKYEMLSDVIFHLRRQRILL